MQINKYKLPLRTASSGIHIEPFFKSYDLSLIEDSLRKGIITLEIPDFIIRNKLLEDYPDLFNSTTFENVSWADTLSYEQEDAYYDIKSLLESDALDCSHVYQTRNYDVEIAYSCGLIPFKIFGDCGDIELLALGDRNNDLRHKLEAYQLLVDTSYDEKSYYAEKGLVYFEYYYGQTSPVVAEIKNLLCSEMGLC